MDHKTHFRDSFEQGTIIFDIQNSDNESPRGLRANELGTKSCRYWIMDPFSGFVPTVLDYDFCVKRERRSYKYTYSSLLDSNVVSSISDFWWNGDSMSFDEREPVLRLIRYLLHSRAHLNPVFYIAENFARADESQFVHHAARKVQALFELQCVDRGPFLRMGLREPSYEARDKFLRDKGCDSFEDAAHSIIESDRASRMAKSVGGLVDYVYACLLILHHVARREQGPASRKTKCYYETLRDELELVGAREALLAVAFFSGNLQGLVPVQPTMKFSKACHRLRASVWDLTLLRLPEQLLNHGFDGTELLLSLPCTADKELARLGRLATYNAIVVVDGECYPVLQVDLSELSGALGGSAAATFSELYGSPEQPKRRPAPSRSRVDSVIARYETELQGMTRTG